jgi:hypothetical protein
MNQQDRFRSIHYVETYYYHDAKDLNPDGIAELKSSRKLTPEEAAQIGAVQVKEMPLKDNDCDVAKQNVAKQAGLADLIAHIDPKRIAAFFSSMRPRIRRKPKNSSFKVWFSPRTTM